MADSFEVDQLEHMKRPQLQKLCKELGFKANRKTSLLISSLKKYKETYLARQNQQTKTPLPEPIVEENVKIPVQTPTLKSENETHVEKGRQKEQEDDDCFKKEMMIHLENKVKETILVKESKIPRLNERNVTFTVKTPTNAPSKFKEHIAFKKMDSIDVYLEKKRKRFESFHQNDKKAMISASKARKIVAEMKTLYNTPTTTSTEKLNGKKARKSFTSANKAFAFGQLKTPKASEVGFASQKTKTPNSRKSFSTATKVKENKTPRESRKSLATITPFRFNANASTTTLSPTPAKRKFDLQASLSKPLSYKPHRGKLAEFKVSTVGSRIPVRNNKIPPACNKKNVDVKNVKITSRAERREQERNSRANKRKNITFQRRGLMG